MNKGSPYIIIFLLGAMPGIAQQDYNEYYRRINLAKDLFVNESFKEAVSTYDSIISDYDYVFVKDLLIAAQISILSENTDKATEWLERA